MIKTLIVAGMVAMASTGQPSDAVFEHADVFHAKVANTITQDLPCYESKGMWPPGTLKFDDRARSQGETETQERSAPANTDCAVV